MNLKPRTKKLQSLIGAYRGLEAGSGQRATELIKENKELKSKLDILQMAPNKLENELKTKEKVNAQKIKQLKDETNVEHENVRQQVETNDEELAELRKTVEINENGLKKYEEIIKAAEHKYEANFKEMETIKRDNDELSNNMELLRKVVKVTEEKL